MPEQKEFVELNPKPRLSQTGLSFTVERGYYVGDKRIITSVQELQVATHFGRIMVLGGSVQVKPPVAESPPPQAKGGVSGTPVISEEQKQ